MVMAANGEGGWPPRIGRMLATPGALPAGGDYGFEWKFEGVRCLGRVRAQGGVRLDSRGLRLVARFPDVVDALGAGFSGRRVSVDGVIVVVAPHSGLPDGALLRQRLAAGVPSSELLDRAPARYVLSDVVYLDDQVTTGLPYRARRALVAELGAGDPRLLVTMGDEGVDGAAMLARAGGHGADGVIAKRLDSPYVPGRSLQWVEAFSRRYLRVVVGGWVPDQSKRGDGLGVLLLGRPASAGACSGGLEYVGAVKIGVKVGWNRHNSLYLRRLLSSLVQAGRPFCSPVPAQHTRYAIWVRPEIIGEVAYRSWTAEGFLHAPAWIGVCPGRTVRDLCATGRTGASEESDGRVPNEFAR